MDAKCWPIFVLRRTPKSFLCPQCGKRGRRKGFLPPRVVLDVAPNGGLQQIQLHLAEYRAACSCCKTFRSSPDSATIDLEPRAIYSNRLRDLVVYRLIGDNLSVGRLQESLRRDFGLDVSEGYVHQCLDWKVGQLDMAAYRAWTLQRFSGTLCLDEVHLGHRTLLKATDPIADLDIAFAVVSVNDETHMRAFLNNLKAHGFEPKFVITDGSPLYPKVLEELWPDARHQLCVFHLLKEINDDILDAVRRLRKEHFPKPSKRKRGRPTKKAAARDRHAKRLEERSQFVWKHRLLIVTAPENLTAADQADLATLLRYLPALRRVREFALAVRGVLDPDLRPRQAWYRYHQLHNNPAYAQDPDLRRALQRLRREKFAKAIAYLSWTHRTKIRTNNHVERMNRRIRLTEKVRYGWRRRRTLVRFIVLSMAAWRERQNHDPPPPKNRIKHRQKPKNQP